LDLAKKLMEMPASKVDIKEVLLSDRFFTEDINTHESATSVIPGLDAYCVNIILQHVFAGQSDVTARVSLVCKTFYNVLQRLMITMPNTTNEQLIDEKKTQINYYEEFRAIVHGPCDEFLKWTKSFKLKTPFWITLEFYTEKDRQFERELVVAYAESIQTTFMKAREALAKWTSIKETYWPVVLGFYDIKCINIYIGFERSSIVGMMCESRIRHMESIRFEEEKKMYLEILDDLEKARIEETLDVAIYLQR